MVADRGAFRAWAGDSADLRRWRRTPLRVRGADPRRLVAAVAAGCAAVTLAFVLVPGLRFGYRNLGAHTSLETAAALVGLLVAFLAIGRLNRQPRLPALLLACGLVALAATNTLLNVVPLLVRGSSGGVVWAAAAGRLGGALLIAVAAFVPSVRLHRRLRLATTTSAALVAVPVLAALLLHSRLPVVATNHLPSAASSPDLHVYSPYLALQMTQALLYAAVAVGLAQRASHTGDDFVRWLAVACTVSCFSHVNYFLYPSLYSDWIYLGDVFRLLFFALLLVACVREIIGYWRIAAEVAASNERRRLAQDLHDGLAQEIAFLRSALSAAGQDRHLPARLAAAAERAERESRQLLSSLAAPPSESFRTLLTSRLGEVAEREHVDVEIHGDTDFQVSARRAEALVRIASEAVTNAARHAGVSDVNVSVDRRGDRIRLAVKDAGSGFDPGSAPRAAAGGRGFGLRSMRGRAAAVGGQLTIASQRDAGTEVVVIV